MKRILSLVLALVLLVCVVPVDAYAFTYKPMSISQNLVDVIKDCEGFASKPYWDYMQYSIGYGTCCGYSDYQVPGEYWSGISREDGERLLRNHMDNYVVDELNNFFRRIGRQPTQGQFDAMADFTYALGSGWMYGNSDGSDTRPARYLKNPTDELGFMNAIGVWCRVNGSVDSALCSRRIREALMYVYGVYARPRGVEGAESLEVVHDEDLPLFRYVIYNGEGTAVSEGGNSDTVEYFHRDMGYGDLLLPTRPGYCFSGWYREDGTLLLSTDRAVNNEEVYARWVKLPFTDVPVNKWYSDAVGYCFEHQLLSGTNSYTFSPYQDMTRAMVVTALYSMAGEPAVSGSSGFSDVSAGKYYADAVTWASQKGIACGHPDGTFHPEALVSRADLVTFLSRYAEIICGASIQSNRDLSAYQDVGQIPKHAREAFPWAVEKGIITGTDGRTLSPDTTAQRAQFARMLMVLDHIS